MTCTRTATLPVSPDEAFALITEPERLRRWQTVSAVVDLRAGGDFRWTVSPGHVAAGSFREVEPGRRVVFGWGWEDSAELPPDASTVTVTIEPAPEGSTVTLVHEGLGEEQERMHGEGWTHYLARLERLASTGDAGPDEWAATPDPMTAVSAAEAVLAAVQPVLRGLTTDDRTKPTPCADFDCHAVAVHLMGSLVGLGAMAGVTVVDAEGTSLENRISVLTAQAIDGWRTVDLDGPVTGPRGNEMPASDAQGLLPFELLMHGWDIAQAAGLPLNVSDEVVDYLRKITEPLMPSARERGAFGPEVSPADDASPLDRLAAYAGRTPIAA